MKGEAEVDDLEGEGRLVHEEEVLGLEIPVGDVLSVAVVDGVEGLLEDLACFQLRKASLLGEEVEKLASLAETR